MSKLKKLLKNWRVILLITFLVFALTSIFTINPTNWFSDGVTIQNIAKDSAAQTAGMVSPDSNAPPLNREKILEINNQEISSTKEYDQIVSSLNVGETARITTNQATYLILLTEDELGEIDLGITVTENANTNLRKGLDLAGGTRVLLQPAETIDDDTLELTISSLYERLNVYGLSDLSISPAKDLAGDQFIVIEIAGATEEEVQELLSKQGKFEAKIANETVFSGGDDITYVCRSADCSGIDPQRGCSAAEDGTNYCSFFFAISLSSEAAKRQADATMDLDVEYSGTSRYLSEDLILFLDNEEVDSLRIGADLQGRATTQIQITGSGQGRTQEEAISNTLQNMKRLQTILITGSLPVELNLVKIDTISPALGAEFLDNLKFVAIIAMIAVFLTISVRYRKLKVALPMSLIMLSEIILILGFAALVGWNMDLAALAGIIIAAGTGVDHLIIITDETLNKEARASSVKARIKAAMFIVMGAYFTTALGMVPLWFAGAGLLKGFAFTTIIGITLGVFIARPAYAAIIRILLDEE